MFFQSFICDDEAKLHLVHRESNNSSEEYFSSWVPILGPNLGSQASVVVRVVVGEKTILVGQCSSFDVIELPCSRKDHL